MTDPRFSDARGAVRSSLEDDGDLAELLHAFAETIPEKREALRALHREGAVDKLRVLSHQIKGAGGGYGFPGLTQAAAALEQACVAKNADQITQAVAYLVEYLDRIET